MLITRKTKVPLHWVFYAQIPFVMSIAGGMVTSTPFLYAMKKFIDNPAAITFLLSIEVFITMLGGPFVSWLSDRVWTRFGRRRPFIIAADIPKALVVFMMPFAPNLMTLIALRWAYGILSDLSAPNQALTMEVVPPPQRGMGAGFFKLQGQVVNLFFFLLVVGRFDDVFFTGPLSGIFALPGETLIFLAGGILFLAVSFYTWFGIHEVEPPTRLSLRDDRGPGENFLKVFFRSFFKDVFHKSLLPLYLLMLVGTLTGVSLGILGPLLYTDQWGYSLQEMGTNIAIGALVGIVAALFAGWLADRTSKMKVYTIGIVLTLLSRIFWTIYVANKPGDRPELHEILLFGTVTNIFGLIVGAASFPLILEYVERNRLGTAGAGMGLFSSTIKNGFTMFTGFFLLWWSIFFLPQAGDKVQLVFREARTEPQVAAQLAAAGYPADALDLKPMFRPGSDGDTSRHWSIRRPIAEAGDIHKQIKDLGTEISSVQLKLQRPNLSAEQKQKLTAEVADLRAQQGRLQARLDDSAKAFREDMTRVFSPDLVAPGEGIVAASTAEGGSRVDLTLEFVDPVTTDTTPRSFGEILGFKTDHGPGRTVTEEFARVMETVDLKRVPGDEPNEFRAELEARPVPGPRNAIQLTLHRDPDFVALENALNEAGVASGAAYNLASEIILPLRGLTRQSTDGYAITSASASLDRVEFALTLPPDLPPLTPDALKTALAALPAVRATEVEGAFPAYRVRLQTKPQPAGVQTEPSAIEERLRQLLPDAPPIEIRGLATLVARATETAAARPVFLTAVRPVVVAVPADREYDYFFSMQYFMILTDVLGLLIILLIVRLEKSGRIVRYGALEDANRTAA